MKPTDLHLEGAMAQDWNTFLHMLRSSGVSLSNDPDLLAWTWNRALGDVTKKLAYEALVAQHTQAESVWWFHALWKVQASVKTILFV
jgi:hypothetical protein